VKTTKKNPATAEGLNAAGKGVAWGMGNWTRANAEFVLLGRRGKPSTPRARGIGNVHQLVFAPRGAHSEKPDEVHERIAHLMGPARRLELFARRPCFGWSAWGNEVDCDVEMAWKENE
ncbi:MAG: hypothetical protein KC492_08495, partial [Myxococcales bacterium]|nr:hypothetical protein [Myxococcales bacterium]